MKERDIHKVASRGNRESLSLFLFFLLFVLLFISATLIRQSSLLRLFVLIRLSRYASLPRVFLGIRWFAHKLLVKSSQTFSSSFFFILVVYNWFPLFAPVGFFCWFVPNDAVVVHIFRLFFSLDKHFVPPGVEGCAPGWFLSRMSSDDWANPSSSYKTATRQAKE